jgi:hypothetical protein
MRVVLNPSEAPEFVHEVGDTWARGADHFGQDLMIHCRHRIVLAETRQFQQDARQPFLAVIEKLIA